MSVAFSPSTLSSRVVSSSMSMAFDAKSQIGAQPPLGFWDPLGLLKNADEKRFNRLRYVETKHGRISMLAILGHLVTTAGFRWPGGPSLDITYSQIPSGLRAFNVLPAAGAWQIVFFIGMMDMAFTTTPGYQDGLEEWCTTKSKWDEKKMTRKKAIELNNGRAAQMGILALMVHEVLDGNPYVLNPVDFNAGTWGPEHAHGMFGW